MDRDEAIIVLKEITSKSDITVNFVNLISPREYDALSKGYQLHIKSIINKDDLAVIQKIVDEHQLTLKEFDENIIIYKIRF